MQRFTIRFLVLASLYGAWPSHARAEEPVRAASASKSDVDDTAERKRILHLQNGQSIRVVSRWKDDHWEYKSKDQWRPLVAGQVSDSKLESEVLKEWETRRGALDTKKVNDRVLLAAWGAEAGLTQEALREIDTVLAADPDHGGALEVLKGHWFVSVPTVRVAAPELAAAKSNLFRTASMWPTSLREIAIDELGQLEDKEALKADLAKELRSNIVVRRGFAAHALRRLYPGECVKPLLMHAVLDPSDDVRRESSFALRAVREPGLTVPVVRALASKSGIVRMHAAEALGNMGYPAAVEPLVARLVAASAAQSSSADRLPHSNIFIGRQIAYVQDFDVEVAQFQAVADPNVNVLIEGSATDAAVAGIQDVEFETESVVLRQSLERLTGERPGRTSRDWLRWWDENGSKWKSSDRSKPTEPSTKSG